MRAYPFFKPLDSSVEWTRWTISSDRSPNIEYLEDEWDTNTTLSFTIAARINPEFNEQARLSPTTPLVLALSAYCPKTIQRINAFFDVDRSTDSVTGTVNVPGHLVAERVLLDAAIVGPGSCSLENSTLVIPQARLASTAQKSFQLDSPSSVFPVILESFSSTRRKNIPWLIESSFSDPADNFASGICVFVNTDFKVAKRLEREADDTALWLLTYEIASYSIRELARLTSSYGRDDLQNLIPEYPQSLVATVQKYADHCQMNLHELLNLSLDSEKAERFETIVKQLASYHVHL